MLKLAELVNQYQKYLERRRVTKKNINSILSYLKIFLRFAGEEELTLVSEINASTMRGFQAWLSEELKANAEARYKVITQARILSTLNTFFNYLLKEELALTNPMRLIRYPRTGKPLVKNVLTKQELAKLFKQKADGSAYDFMCKVVMIFQYATGLRINEVLNIRLKEIDVKEKQVLVYDPKQKTNRTVLFGSVAKKYLELYLKKVRSRILWGRVSEYLFPSYRGTILNEETVNDYLAYFKRKAGIQKHITSHCFRHSYATHMLENGVGIKEIATFLGHKKLDTTMSYTRVSPLDLRKIINSYHPREAGKANKKGANKC
jgi:integrase/recombinase XerD